MKCVCRLRIIGRSRWRGQKFRLMYTREICSGGNIFIRRIFNCRINLRCFLALKSPKKVGGGGEKSSELHRTSELSLEIAWNLSGAKDEDPNTRVAPGSVTFWRKPFAVIRRRRSNYCECRLCRLLLTYGGGGHERTCATERRSLEG